MSLLGCVLGGLVVASSLFWVVQGRIRERGRERVGGIRKGLRVSMKERMLDSEGDLYLY